MIFRICNHANITYWSETMLKDEMLDLIPDYLEGRLSDKDRARLETAIENNSDIAAEFKFQKNIKTALRADTSNDTPDQLGWARLEKSLAKDTSNKDTSNTAQNAPIAVNDNPKPSPFWRYAAACLGVALLGQTIFMSTQLNNNNTSDDKYLPVLTAPAYHFSLKVEFTATAKTSDITELLTKSQGNIISGPTTLGLYEINFASEAARTQAEMIFRKSADVVASQGRP